MKAFGHIVSELSRNADIFRHLLQGTEKEMYVWKYLPEKWCLLEIICHLYDEEREDFRARLNHVLNTPEEQLPAIDPVGWVFSRSYIQQEFEAKLNAFLSEREKSVQWLRNLESPKWDNAYVHPNFGPMSGSLFLANWLEHDYLHIRQILRVKHEYLKHISAESLSYAGEW